MFMLPMNAMKDASIADTYSIRLNVRQT